MKDWGYESSDGSFEIQKKEILDSTSTVKITIQKPVLYI